MVEQYARNGVLFNIAHGIGRIKAITFKAVPAVIKKGRIVDYQINWKGREYDTVVFAAPITVKRSYGTIDEYFVAVIVIRAQKHQKQRFYVHEAIAIKKEDLLFKTGIDAKSNKGTGNSSSFIYSILQKVVNYNESEENATKKSLKVILSEDSLGKTLTYAQKDFFENAKTIDEDGNLKRFYHGTSRGDRVGYYFNPERATSGPMAFFTDSQEIAGNYARDKQDTSIAYDSEYDSYETQFVEQYARNGVLFNY